MMDMLEEINQQTVAILISALAVIVTGIISLRSAKSSSKKNRQISNAKLLINEFFDPSFADRRLQSIETLRSLKGKNANYVDLIKFVSNSCNDKDIKERFECVKVVNDDVLTLNQLAAFYKTMASLIDNEEVDLKILKDVFSYNYIYIWNDIRQNFLKNTDNEEAQKLFCNIHIFEGGQNG